MSSEDDPKKFVRDERMKKRVDQWKRKFQGIATADNNNDIGRRSNANTVEDSDKMRHNKAMLSSPSENVAEDVKAFLLDNEDKTFDREDSYRAVPLPDDHGVSYEEEGSSFVVQPGAIFVPGIGTGQIVDRRYDMDLEHSTQSGSFICADGAEISGERERQLEQELEALQQARDELARALESVVAIGVVVIEDTSTVETEKNIAIKAYACLSLVLMSILVVLITLLIRRGIIKPPNEGPQTNNNFTRPSTFDPEAFSTSPTMAPSVKRSYRSMYPSVIINNDKESISSNKTIYSSGNSEEISIFPTSSPMVSSLAPFELGRLDILNRQPTLHFAVPATAKEPPADLAVTGTTPPPISTPSIAQAPMSAPTATPPPQPSISIPPSRLTLTPSPMPTSRQAVRPVLRQSLTPSLRPSLRPDLRQSVTTTLRPTFMQNSSPISIPISIPMSRTTSKPNFSLQEIGIPSSCVLQYNQYQNCLSKLSEAGKKDCTTCVDVSLPSATNESSCTRAQQSFCYFFESCHDPCKTCSAFVDAYASCTSTCTIDCTDPISPNPTRAPTTPLPTVPKPTPVPTRPRPTSSPSPQPTALPILDSPEKLRAAVDRYVQDSTGMPPIGSWDVSRITDMSHLFNGWDRNDAMRNFTGDISKWDVSRVTDMCHMFDFAQSFQGDLSSWDVSSVTNMFGMFWDAQRFNSDISEWDVSKVSDMSVMFAGANSFNKPLSNWDVSNVKSLWGMFAFASSMNQDLSTWSISKGTDMYGMFYYAEQFNADISSWDVSSVTQMSGMFYGASSFNQDISSWNVSSVRDISYMFSNATSFNNNLCTWGQLLSTATVVTDMFLGSSSCPTQQMPNLAVKPPDPFYYKCIPEVYLL